MLEPNGRQHDRKQLAEALKELRKAAGLSGERLAARAAMSQSKISRIESGKILPSVADVQRLLSALEVPAAVTQNLLSLTRAANVDYASWRSYARIGIWRKQAELKALAESSAVVQQFLPAIPSGLLQTREYARAVLTPTVEGRPALDVDLAVEARLDSQGALDDPTRRFVFLLTEQAIRWPRATPDVMATQCAHMAEVAQRPNVELAIIPFSGLVTAAPLNVFVLYDDRLVIIELTSGEMALRDPRDIAYHQNLFDHFLAGDSTVHGESARKLLESTAADFMQGRG
jgi:transcriptional regulator with XRE-family HTH domain